MDRRETLLYQAHHPDRQISRILIVPEAAEASTRESVLDLEGDCLAPSRIHGYQYRETRVRVLVLEDFPSTTHSYLNPTPNSLPFIVSVTGRDADLEAFSHNPTSGSFAALIDRLTAVPGTRYNRSSRT